MNLLLIGGGGFVSGTIARNAMARGWKVDCLTRGRKPLPAGARPIVADRHDIPAATTALRSATDTWDAVIDCIAYHPDEMRQDIEWFTGRCGRFIFISTDFVFDPNQRRFPQPVDSPTLDDDSYGGKKFRCEKLLHQSPKLSWTIFRPNHIYGPGSLLGCLPRHGRDDQLIERLRRREPLHLVGGGHFLQQPIFADDLANLALSTIGNSRAERKTYPAAGPEMIESAHYYQLLANDLNVPLTIQEIPLQEHLRSNPADRPFLCHRIYDLRPLADDRLTVPSTSMFDGLKRHLHWLIDPTSSP
ncbi:MAG: NAD-dependent epimerase/dehydratase family protein [Phycisphaerales bacterium]|jgi:nucleoside-diphosphate-sugar epimerase|nr:NAD-dependent epimerase/dehydratase family protein [Phycisphaerales bacterium]